ncbi:MAG: dihydrodipicolinate synthase family protein [Actinobacteria bacterium]|nr:dihydrodipicolinate synthase family protein [Actinomycetota bacterium]
MATTGVLTALVTPFHADGSIDDAGIQRHVDRQVAAGIHAVVPLGTTGEFTTMTHDERKHVTEAVIEAAAGRIGVFPHTGAQSTAETIELSVHAQKAGATGLMIVPPYYDPLSIPALHAHLTAVGEAVDIPIVYYNVPGATGIRLDAEELAALGDIKNVDYIKDTSGDFTTVTAMLIGNADRITLFNGWDTLTFGALATGAKGSVWGMGNLLPEQAVRLFEALAIKGDLIEGRRLWKGLWKVNSLLESTNYVAAIKGGLEDLGFSAGPVRAPLQPASAEFRAELATALRAALVL